MPAGTKRFNVGTRPFLPVELLLLRLIDEIRNRHIPIDQGFLPIIAHEVYTLLLAKVHPLGFPRPEFSSGWAGFKRFWDIKYSKLMGEAASVDWPKIVKRVEDIQNIISGYSLDDVYNADET
ncbi:hypothetical protein BGZ65_005863, partial [Modicella reniformis]